MFDSVLICGWLCTRCNNRFYFCKNRRRHFCQSSRHGYWFGWQSWWV